MTTIDQRILIPASPDVVWAYISSLERNPEWRVDHKDLTFITSFRKGQGARWRYSSGSRQDYVAEITAWYERLGYEYRIVDGGPFKTNRGRIRLQEIAEGTVIQWTFNYEIGGLLGGMRDAIGVRRSMENIIVDSLWALWRNIGQDESARAEPHTPKMLMREAPDVQSRANYTPRHPSVMRAGASSPSTAAPESSLLQQQVQQSADEPAPPPPEAAPAASASPIVEPPISDEDTRPRPSVAAGQETSPPAAQAEPPATPAEPAVEREPDFLEKLVPAGDVDQPPPPADDVFKPPQPVEIQPEPPVEAAPSPAPAEDEPPSPEPVREPAAHTLDTDPQPQDKAPVLPETLSSGEPEPATPEQHEAETRPRTDISDPGGVSVFELFGVPRPSETQTSDVAQPEPEPESTPLDTETAPVEPVSAIPEPEAPAVEEQLDTETEPEAAHPAPAVEEQPEVEDKQEPEATQPATSEPAATVEDTQEPETATPELAAATPEPLPTSEPRPIIIAGELTGRVGLRLRLRRSQVRLRRPS